MANMNKDFFSKLGNTISAAGKDGLGKAKEWRDTAKISVDIKEREGAIQKMYRELGKAYYHEHKNDEECEYADRLEAIKAAFEEIGELKAMKDEIRGIRRCPECGQPVAAKAKFCENCGAKCEEEVVECEVVDEEETEDEPVEESAEETAEESVEETAEAEEPLDAEATEGETTAE
ncbi:MAG: zinc ribbon domain-containing protein [Clostridiales bacterium]|nr:zinc ribbon domain-containing protein [Clostridiales bacterium]